jgi:hypothetical protein
MHGIRRLRVIAAPAASAAAKAGCSRQVLEMVVCLTASGHLDATLQDVLPQRCRLIYGDRTEWSGVIRADDNGWVVHSDLGDDEPIRLLHVRTLRPGDYLTIYRPGEEAACFRVEGISLAF